VYGNAQGVGHSESKVPSQERVLTLRTPYLERVLPSINPVRNIFKIKMPVILLFRGVTIGI